MGKRLQEQDIAFATHEQYYKEYTKCNDLLILENVPEYKEKLVASHLGPSWAMDSTRLDPRIFGMGVSRPRVYIICWRKNVLKWAADFRLDEFVRALAAKPVSDATGLKISPLVLRYQLPSDGLPNMQQWMNTAAEIYLGGFESVREPFEVKPQDDGQLVTMKGTGRTAIILFGLIWTYLELSKTMTDLEKDDFSRWLKTVTSIFVVVVLQSHSHHYDWRRLQVHESQSERQRKSPMQKALTFSKRADEKVHQDPHKYSGPDGYKAAFLDGIEEFNRFGHAAGNAKFQIDPEQALELYGMKVA
ncbi:PABC domain-containing protein [Durusdinium trenchii]|uniref:PABC domain-containing protein n=1 Tax=Durusdinium trenchii TaxID=1381693 RepID=A0ABP0ME32_9DINO